MKSRWPTLLCATILALVVRTPVSFAQAESPSAAAGRFYDEYMGGGVVLNLLGDRWFTPRFRDVMNAWDNAPLQKPIEGNPVLPWKDWAAWRHKFKTEELQASEHRALVVVTFAVDEKGQPIARLVHLEKVGGVWRVDDVTEPPLKNP